MTTRAIFLVATLHLLAYPATAEESPGALVAQLGALVPAHHELQGFAGKADWYRYRPPPEVRYVQPDFEAWAATLEETAVDPEASQFIAIWHDADGAIRHILSKGDHVRLFSIDGDVVDFEDPGFFTQAGVARWGWHYGEGLLQTHRTWRFAIGPVDDSGRPTGPPTPSALYAVTTYEYDRGQVVPSRSRTYWSEEDRLAGRWGQKTSYGPDGRHRKTKHNKERPYPY